MKEQIFAAGDFERYRKSTRREQFRADTNKVIPWGKLCAQIAPYYPKVSAPAGLARVLRIHFLQHWLNRSDPGAEEMLCESFSMCRFVSIGHGQEPISDESGLLNFRHLIERHQFGQPLEARKFLARRADGLTMGMRCERCADTFRRRARLETRRASSDLR